MEFLIDRVAGWLRGLAINDPLRLIAEAAGIRRQWRDPLARRLARRMKKEARRGMEQAKKMTKEEELDAEIAAVRRQLFAARKLTHAAGKRLKVLEKIRRGVASGRLQFKSGGEETR